MRRGLKLVDSRLPKALTVAHKKVSQKVVDQAKPKIAGLPSPGGSKAMSGLTARGSQTSAKVILQGSNHTIRANVLGTLSHKAWGRHVSGSGPWQPWLGQSWSPEDLYGLGPALTDVVDGFGLDEYADAFMDALAVAFPD
jgi:hypothetical protein